MNKISIIGLLISFVSFLSGICFNDISNIIYSLSFIFGILSFIFLYKSHSNYQYFIYILFCISVILKGTLFEANIMLLIGLCFYNLIAIIYVFDNIKYKLNLMDIIGLFILIVGMFFNISFYYIAIIFLCLYSTIPVVYNLYKSVSLKELEKNNIEVINFTKFEKLGSIRNIIFTKTGVLTLGQLEINKVVTKNENKFWKYISYAEATRKDRIGKVIMHASKYDKIDLNKRIDYQDFYNGISYKIGNNSVLVGNSSFLHEHDIEVIEEVLVGTVIYVSVDKEVIGYLVLTDKMRLSTKNIIREFRKLGIKNFSVFSNDQERLTTVVSRNVGIFSNYGNLTQQSKDFWLYYFKQINGNSIALISDDHVDFNVDIKINLNTSSFNNKMKSDIIVLDKNLNKCLYLFELSNNLKSCKNNLYILTFIGKLLFVLIGLVFISDIWLLVLIIFIWMLLEIIIGCNDLLK